MKKMLMIITIASVFAACKSDPNDLQTNKVMLTDSSGTTNSSASSDTATAVQKGARPVVVSKSSSSETTKTSTSNSGSTTAPRATGLRPLLLQQPPA